MTHDDVSILMSPLTFDPSIVEMFIALSAGAQLLLVSDVIKMVPQKLESVIEKYRVTVMQVPDLLSSILYLKNLCGTSRSYYNINHYP